jgi:hypothetical protein
VADDDVKTVARLPFYPMFLVPALLFAITPSTDGVPLWDMLGTLLVPTGLIAAAVLLATRITGRPAVVGVIMLPLCPYLLLSTWGTPALFLLVVSLALAPMAIKSSDEALEAPTTMLNAFGAIFLVFAALPFVMFEVTSSLYGENEPALVGMTSPENAPSILHVMLDGYGDPEWLQEHIGCRPRLAAGLASRGFSVPKAVHSNYAQTLLSTTSMMEMALLNDHGSPWLLDYRSQVRARLRNNRVSTTLRSMGYTIESYPSEYSPVRWRGETYAPWYSPNLVAYLVMGQGIVATASVWGGKPQNTVMHRAHFDRLTWTLLHAEEPWRQSPTYRFVHMLAPHPPFTISATGAYVRDETTATIHDGPHWAAAHDGFDGYAQGYCDKAKWLDDGVLGLVDGVLARDPQTVILIHGDHGPGIGLRWDDVDASDLAERYGVLLAVRGPPEVVAGLYDGMTLVNVFPAIFNGLFGGQIERSPDRAYWTGWDEPGEIQDVTDRL